MKKAEKFTILKKTKARTQHSCNNCGKVILPGEIYFKERIREKSPSWLFLTSSIELCGRCRQIPLEIAKTELQKRLEKKVTNKTEQQELKFQKMQDENPSICFPYLNAFRTSQKTLNSISQFNISVENL